MFRLEDAALPVFARHETFHPRYGWFGKAVSASAVSPTVFTEEDATVTLGVGKNMVRAIRFWGKAAKLLGEVPDFGRPRAPLTVPSFNGIALFDEEKGFDPYLELPGSLWLLHWWMLTPKSSLPVWWLTFNRFRSLEFSEDEVLDFVGSELEASSWNLPVQASIKKDVDCLLRMYAPHVAGKIALDDLLDCPFRELGLIEKVWDDNKRFRFVLGPKPTLPSAILAYACLQYMAMTLSGAQTSMFSRLVYGPSSPGQIFKLTEEALIDALQEHSRRQSGVRIMLVAGLPQLTVEGDVTEQSLEALHIYYRACGRSVEYAMRLGPEAAAAPPSLIGDYVVHETRHALA